MATSAAHVINYARRAMVLPGGRFGYLFCLAVAVLVLTAVLGEFASSCAAVGQQRGNLSNGPSLLEVHLASPLKWENGCLVVSLDRTNHTSMPLFLPNRGIYMDTSVRESPEETGKKDGVEWINVYGLSDIGDWDAKPIGPGATVHDEYCLPPTVAVVSKQKKSRREMQLRGKLRIKAYYFPTEKDWLTSKRQHQEMFNMSEEELHRMRVLYPQANTLVIAIPCRKTDCPSDCDKAAILLYGERRIVPDIYDFMPGWNERGRALNDGMAGKSPTCPGSDATSP